MLPVLVLPALPRYWNLVDQWRRFVAQQDRLYAARAAARGDAYIALSVFEVEFAAQMVATAGLVPPEDDF